MDHAVSVEEVVTGNRLVEWVGAVTDVDAFNAFWDFAGDWEGVGDRVFRYWGEVTGDLDSWVGGFGKWVLALVGD